MISRRDFLRSALAAGTSVAVESPLFGSAPAIVARDSARPQTPSGLQIGDVLTDRAVIWSRTNRPARLVVEGSFHEDFRNAVRVAGPVARPSTDFTARVDLRNLPAGQDVFVRVTFEDDSNGRTKSAPLEGHFRTAPTDQQNIRFVWSGDTAGQGYGINPDWGGMRIYETMRRTDPDFFIHSGDTIYADIPILPTMTSGDGTVWKNIVTDEVGKVAEDLREFYGRFRYNLLDENVRRFSASVPQLWQWDDHEVVNNWSDSTDLSANAQYREKDVHVLAARARRAFLDYSPMRFHAPDDRDRIYRHVPRGPLIDIFMLDERSYRGPNNFNRQERQDRDTAFLGATQVGWLKQQLASSTALWKIIASDMPIGLLVFDGKDRAGRDKFEAVANGPGPALGRELEIADILRFIKRERVRNVIWITADVHYTAAHYYDPAAAHFQDFDPFWEFVSGPLNAGSFGPNTLDDTFGPRVVFQKAPPVQNAPPSAGYQFFGQIDLDARTGMLMVTLKDVAGASLFAQPIEPLRT
jgi:alkaline phosphatase D